MSGSAEVLQRLQRVFVGAPDDDNVGCYVPDTYSRGCSSPQRRWRNLGRPSVDRKESGTSLALRKLSGTLPVLGHPQWFSPVPPLGPVPRNTVPLPCRPASLSGWVPCVVTQGISCLPQPPSPILCPPLAPPTQAPTDPSPLPPPLAPGHAPYTYHHTCHAPGSGMSGLGMPGQAWADVERWRQV